MSREYFAAYHSLLQSLTPFGDAECGRLFKAALKYSATGEEEEFRGNERFIWPTIKAMIDRDKAAYEDKCRINRANGQKGVTAPDRPRPVANAPQEKEKEKGEEKEEEKEKVPKGTNKTRAFIPPTLDEVIAYCRERNSTVDPRRFFDYFTAGGWVDGQGQPVRNWKQKLITWEGRKQGGHTGTVPTGNPGRDWGDIKGIPLD